MDKICKNCVYWMTKQRDLGYIDDWGICEADLQHNWDDPKMIKIHAKHYFLDGLVDNEGTISPHSMMICTNKQFGCVKWEEKSED